MERLTEARLPEWSKGVDSSSTVQEYSWVQIPQRAFFVSFRNRNLSFICEILTNVIIIRLEVY